MLDYLIVGLGLAGISFCATLERHGRSFRVIAGHAPSATAVAAGLYNPVVLKRFKMAWRADEQLGVLPAFYKDLENQLGITLNHPMPLLRKFASAAEHRLWHQASGTVELQNYLSLPLLPNANPLITAPFGFGEVKQCGRIDTGLMSDAYGRYLSAKELLLSEAFDAARLEARGDYVSYKGIRAKRLIMATGYGLRAIPLFDYLPLNGNKGEMLTVYCSELKENRALKSSIFFIPLGDDLYAAGATYDRYDKSPLPTGAAKDALVRQLRALIQCEFQVVAHRAGIRPTVTDHRPLAGRHPAYPGVYVLNGLGSRGVMLAPFISGLLFEHIEYGKPLPAEIDIRRFSKRFRPENRDRQRGRSG